MRVAGILENDIVDGENGICVSLWVQGCNLKCKNCHNPELWDFDCGDVIDNKNVADILIEKISKNGLTRDLSILGGEPFDDRNINDVLDVIKKVREKYGNKIRIYVWTGYYFNEVPNQNILKEITGYVDAIIDGPYIDEKRDTTLKLRGSSNQHIIYFNRNGEKTNDRKN